MISRSGVKDPNGWYRDWRGKTVVVVASGPSAADAPIQLARGLLPVIVTNSSWRLAPWADVLYGCDAAWWVVNQGAPLFRGLKITSNNSASTQFPDVYRVRLEGTNSGIRAVRLAARYGANRIVLVGFDMHSRAGVHWHGLHPPPELRNARAGKMEIWRKEMDAAAPKLKAAGVEIVNTSRASALTAYRFVPFAEAIRHGGHGTHRADQPGYRSADQ